MENVQIIENTDGTYSVINSTDELLTTSDKAAALALYKALYTIEHMLIALEDGSVSEARAMVTLLAGDDVAFGMESTGRE